MNANDYKVNSKYFTLKVKAKKGSKVRKLRKQGREVWHLLRIGSMRYMKFHISIKIINGKCNRNIQKIYLCLKSICLLFNTETVENCLVTIGYWKLKKYDHLKLSS